VPRLIICQAAAVRNSKLGRRFRRNDAGVAYPDPVKRAGKSGALIGNKGGAGGLRRPYRLATTLTLRPLFDYRRARTGTAGAANGTRVAAAMR